MSKTNADGRISVFGNSRSGRHSACRRAGLSAYAARQSAASARRWQPGGKNHTHFVNLSTAVPPAGARWPQRRAAESRPPRQATGL